AAPTVEVQSTTVPVADAVLATVTLIVDTAELAAASLATASSVCWPLPTFVVSQVTSYGADVSSAPRFDPSSLNCTPATPTLSDAVADTVSVDETVAPAAGELIETVGFVVSPCCGPAVTLTLSNCAVTQTPRWALCT